LNPASIVSAARAAAGPRQGAAWGRRHRDRRARPRGRPARLAPRPAQIYSQATRNYTTNGIVYSAK